MQVLCKHEPHVIKSRAGPVGKNTRYRGTWGEYQNLHQRIRRKKKLPNSCQSCGVVGKLEWSNISGEYSEDFDDYEALCVPCHRRKDLGGIPKIPKETCNHGHSMTESNTRYRINAKGHTYRTCRQCIREGARRRYHEKSM